MPDPAIGLARFDAKAPYGATFTGNLHVPLMLGVGVPSEPYIAASLLMDAESDFYRRNAVMAPYSREAQEVIDQYFVPYVDPKNVPNGYSFAGIVHKKYGGQVALKIESDVAAALGATYVVTERVRQFAQALHKALPKGFLPTIQDDSGTGDGLNGITSRLFDIYESETQTGDLTTLRKILRVRSDRTHRQHLYVEFEINNSKHIIDFVYRALSLTSFGTYDILLRESERLDSVDELTRFIKWFSEMTNAHLDSLNPI